MTFPIILNNNNNNMSIDKSALWEFLHTNDCPEDEFDVERQFSKFKAVVDVLKKEANCPCKVDAIKMFNGLFFDSGELDKDSGLSASFLKIKNAKNFFCFFHNLVNLKLGKPKCDIYL